MPTPLRSWQAMGRWKLLTNKLLAFAALFLLSVGASAQQPKPIAAQAKPIGPQPVNSSAGTFYPLPADPRGKIRDLQYQWDQLEIQNQKLLLQVQQNQQKQRDLMDGEKRVAWDYANDKRIDLGLFELDPDDVKFIPKKIGDKK
jgi:hypothetical protein